MPLELPLPAASKVTFLFDGLFFFCFRDQVGAGDISRWREGQVGILPDVPDHALKIVIMVDLPDKPILLELTDPRHSLRHFLDGLVVKKADSRGYITRDDHRIERDKPDIQPHSFKWVIDFEGPEMHDSTLMKTNEVLRPRLSFRDGHFHTALVNHCPQNLRRRGQGEEPFGHVARLMGVEIDLDSGESLLAEIRGVPFILAENPGDGSTEYIVYISNSEPYGAHIGDGSDIHFFYDRFLRDPSGLTFDFVPVDETCEEPPIFGHPAIEPFVCYGTTGRRTSEIG